MLWNVRSSRGGVIAQAVYTPNMGVVQKRGVGGERSRQLASYCPSSDIIASKTTLTFNVDGNVFC